MNTILKKIKIKWLAYLAKLAKANEETYGTQRLDCCELNNEKKVHSK